MKTNEEKHKQTQSQIIKFLFDQTKPASLETLCELIKQTSNETKYHIERLREERLLENKSVEQGGRFYDGYVISQKGRKLLMEGPQE